MAPPLFAFLLLQMLDRLCFAGPEKQNAAYPRRDTPRLLIDGKPDQSDFR